MKKNILSMGIETFFFENCALKCRCLHPASFPAHRPLPPKGRTAWQPALCQFLLWRNFLRRLGPVLWRGGFCPMRSPGVLRRERRPGPAAERKGRGGTARSRSRIKKSRQLSPACLHSPRKRRRRPGMDHGKTFRLWETR